MKILILKASGRKGGSSALLAEAFAQGAEECGHTITEYDVIHADIRPCLGCGACGMNGPCVQKDDYENTLKGMIRDADMLVFAMPVYYYNWPAQMKTVIDRFFSFTSELTAMHKMTALLSVAWDDTDTVFDVVESYYYRLCSYMQFENRGTVLGRGCGSRTMTQRTGYPDQAYALGKSLTDE